jgi:nucleotidyltransferase substrate binding protein (TIGR01987 family)
MDKMVIDLSALQRALGQLTEALSLWHEQPQGSVLKRHLRSAVIQSFEFSYELAMRSLRRVLIERASAADRVVDLSFNELLRAAADAGLMDNPLAWREWRELRNATSHAYDEAKAQQVAEDAQRFAVSAALLLAALERAS